MSDSIIEIRKFMELTKYKRDGILVEFRVTAISNAEILYDEITECSFSYHVGYAQYELRVDWKINDNAMHALGLHAAYNTNFQYFTFEDGKLYVDADNVIIQLEKAE